MLVAQIAQITLAKRNPKAIQLAEKIANVLKPLSHGSITNYVESACWPDDMKNYKLGTMDTWHFADMKVCLSEIKSILQSKPQTKQQLKRALISKDKPEVDLKCENCGVSVIKDLTKTLTTWTADETKNLDGLFEKSFALRFMTHVIGDMHQPLHAAGLFDEVLFPKGDRGGNSFKISYTGTTVLKNLHSFLDSGADGFPTYKRPLSKKDSDDMLTFANALIAEQTEKTKMPENDIDHEKWVMESYNLGKGSIYNSINPNDAITEEFKKKCYDLLRTRVYQGGLRVAGVIERMYAAYEKEASAEQLKVKFLKK